MWTRWAKAEGMLRSLIWSAVETASSFNLSVEVCLAELKFSLPVSLLLCLRNKPNMEVNDEQVFLRLWVWNGLFCSYGN